MIKSYQSHEAKYNRTKRFLKGALNSFYFVAFWLVYLLIDILKKSLFVRKEFDYIYYYYYPSFLYWIILTIPVYYLFKWSRAFSSPIRELLLLLIGIGLGQTKNLLSWYTYYFVYDRHQIDGHVQFVDFVYDIKPFYFIESMIVGLLVIIILYVLELNGKYRAKQVEAAELGAELTKSKLRALRMQLQPHFLFNVHNTISMLIRTEKNTEAIDMISKLSTLLRYSLRDEESQFATVEQEVSMLKEYLGIESVRFEDHLDITFDIDPTTHDVEIPQFLLQPIIENSFKHGVSKHAGFSTIDIQVKKHDNSLLISIFNSGPQLPDDFDMERDKKIGIDNILSRLKTLYAGQATFQLTNLERGVLAVLKIPIRNED